VLVILVVAAAAVTAVVAVVVAEAKVPYIVVIHQAMN
jgi:hypothetical protein